MTPKVLGFACLIALSACTGQTPRDSKPAPAAESETGVSISGSVRYGATW